MPFDPDRHHRRSIRLPFYDYRRFGAYFVTICTFQRALVLDQQLVSELILQTWRAIGKYAPAARGDAFVVMPNHVHGIIWLDGGSSSNSAASLTPLRMSQNTGHPIVEPGSLGAIVRAFKSSSAQRVNAVRKTPKRPVWQRGYHERIIRSDSELERVREYIRNNPQKWADDPNNPANWPHQRQYT